MIADNLEAKEIIWAIEEQRIFDDALWKINRYNKDNTELNLSSLGITDNILTKLLPAINKFTKLEKLNLEGNKITAIHNGANIIFKI